MTKFTEQKGREKAVAGTSLSEPSGLTQSHGDYK